ncbi:unnamed protein product [Schistosoma margrebowiei]|uniref:Uncharacterized protein n=1 Tax=Schistosoma margrebowiei TaxID=48269 RepID=A0AA85AID8_9TREM|nr:unnamed protein product [Schistosoma margrebowiei]
MRRLGHVSVAQGIKKRIDEPGVKVELHLFSVASEFDKRAAAYAPVSYLKKPPYCILLYSKSSVPPIEEITKPKLEMSASVLGIRASEVLRRVCPNFSAI